MSSMDQEYEQAETMLQRAVSVTEEGWVDSVVLKS